ncbi:uncharacterized protein LOC130190678 [Pseudoliparis swirei]|uniref:uncharacterized protein LOC130190678 n=1 Tax=Pseudoliparis swirei TaxID=2059687 RepID=UPI0024BDAD3C|nr:uncharacterized protein LOC130190678 [Pseudoliparis swirei]XP_056266197.1 uncharacterized protein LOC130190678 [Pseudoliparis swirei]
MPVAIRKRSWAEPVTHASGLQYSYDDLDLVCRHGVDGEGAGSSKQGRRTRCASMPEGCRHLPSLDRTLEARTLEAQTLEAQTLEARTLEAQTLEARTLEAQTLEAQTLEARTLEARTLEAQTLEAQTLEAQTLEAQALEAQTLEAQTLEVCDSTASGQPKLLASGVKVQGPNELLGGSPASRASGSEPLHIADTGKSAERLCDPNPRAAGSIGPTKEALNGGSGGESSQSHNICHGDDVFKSPHVSREGQQCISIWSNNGPPLCGWAAAPPGDLPQRQETKEIHTEGHSRAPGAAQAARNRFSAAGPEPQTDLSDLQEDEISTSGHASVTTPVGSVGAMESGAAMSPADGSVGTAETSLVEEDQDKGGSGEAAAEPDGSNEPETLNENTGLHSSEARGAEPDRRSRGCERPHRALWERRSEEMTAMPEPQGEEGAGGSREVRCEPIASAHVCRNSNKSAVRMDPGSSEDMTTSWSADRRAEPSTSFSRPIESSDVAPLAGCDHETTMLDAIPEVIPDAPGLDPQQHTPDVPHVDVDHAASQQQTDNPPPAEVAHGLPPEGLHGNRAHGEAPGRQVADGQRERQRPRARMEEPAAHRGPPGASPAGGPVAGVRMRKREHARLDSMVLLLMKLDQLDQEIENALSASSAMGGTPTPHRRPLQQSDGGPAAAPLHHPHGPPSLHHPHGPAAALRVRPKSESSSSGPEEPAGESSAHLPHAQGLGSRPPGPRRHRGQTCGCLVWSGSGVM